METLAKPLRRQLEDTVVKARDAAENAARAALMHLGVGDAEAAKHLTDDERALRRRLRAHGRQLGDQLGADGHQAIDRLVQETAYEHWHRMLFARFLAENSLLMHPDGVAVTLAECDELAEYEDAADGWELAGRYASRMLPQIFRPDSPVLALNLAPEHQRALEKLLAGLHPDTFQASDSLGWVYQFWQTKRKDQVNASEVKIGADELPAVTQLFTEPYMVAFLLDNSLGAWWAARRLSDEDLRTAESEDALRRKAAIPGLPLEYLRFVRPPTVARASSPDVPGQDGLATVLASVPATAQGLDESTLKKTHGENLPHWTCDNAVYHVVFRLADSILKTKLQAWAEERDAQAQAAEREGYHPTDAAHRQIANQYRERIETYLDAGHGACHLAKPEIAEIVADALKHFDDQRYRLHAWCVMPNHVHVIVEPLPGQELSKIIHSWKSFTANAINKHLNRTGTFWQEDAYNHIIRNEKEYDFQIHYVWQNPDKASIPDWPWRHAATVARASSPGTILNAPNPDSPGQDGLATVTDKDWTPAAGTFDSWPEHLGELRVLDPCCGSGHFLVAAFQMLVPMRMTLEHLSAQDAVDAVLRDNLHGLELDQRCVEIAAFALALSAWRYPNAIGYRPLPQLNIACSGLGIHAAKADWLQLADGNVDLEHALERLYDLFKDAPTLGSLIDPRQAFSDDLLDLNWESVAPLLDQALCVDAASSREQCQSGATSDELAERRELGVTAQGLARAAELLAGQYHWVVTNVPYLSRGKQSARLKEFCETHYPNAKNDLANVFLERCLEFSHTHGAGVVQIVMPQNWLFLTSYRKQREHLLREVSWNLLARLGMAAFQIMDWWAFNVIALTLMRSTAASESKLLGVDASVPRSVSEKAHLLRTSDLSSVRQVSQLANPDSRVTSVDLPAGKLLEEYAYAPNGMHAGDSRRFRLMFWEVLAIKPNWAFFQCAVDETEVYGGREHLFYWPNRGQIHRENPQARVQGDVVWGKPGVVVRVMRHLPVTIYSGELFDISCVPVTPGDRALLPALWCYCSSSEFNEAVRIIDQKLNVTNATLAKVPFDLPHWQTIAAERYPNGLPIPYSDDPTQWIFHGHPCGSVVWDEEAKWTVIGSKRTDATVLQTAVARLLGYRWAAEEGSCGATVPCVARASSPGSPGQDGLATQLELSDESRSLIVEAQKLNTFSDDDGIVCLPAIRGEPAAHERLLHLLEAAYSDDWTANTLGKLLTEAGAKGKGLDIWLRDHFFEQHCKLFHNRPFIWHIWDGLKDGFAALVNYHKLDRANLERLIYTYLGDWIRMQERAAGDGVQGADERLAAAKGLKDKLEAILEGEAPLDIFVRWKPIEEQPIGWEPDLNDGVRLNIRPFLLAGDVGKKGAGILRAKPNVHWKKDCGKDVESAPWCHLFNGDRINDHHLTLAEKRAARGSA